MRDPLTYRSAIRNAARTGRRGGIGPRTLRLDASLPHRLDRATWRAVQRAAERRAAGRWDGIAA